MSATIDLGGLIALRDDAAPHLVNLLARLRADDGEALHEATALHERETAIIDELADRIASFANGDDARENVEEGLRVVVEDLNVLGDLSHEIDLHKSRAELRAALVHVERFAEGLSTDPVLCRGYLSSIIEQEVRDAVVRLWEPA